MKPLLKMLLLLGLVAGVAVAADNPILATVAGQPITQQDLLQYALPSPRLQVFLHIPGGPERLLDNLIMERLLVREGKRLGIARPKGKLATDDFAYAVKVRDQLVKPCVVPKDKALHAFYRQHPALFSTPLFIRTRRIGLPFTQTDEQQVEQRLQKLRQQLRQNKLDFTTAVHESSQDPLTKDRDGDVGFADIDAFPQALAAKLRQAKPGAFIGPVAQGNMLFLYQVTDRHEPILGAYDTAEVRKTYLQHCRQQALATLMAKLKARWPVKILITDLKAALQRAP